MTSIDIGLAALRTAAVGLLDLYDRFGLWLKSMMPKGLYARALLIIIVPMVVLQSVVAFVFMERHWNLVTQRLSAGVVQDIAALIEIYKGYPQDADRTLLRRIALERLDLIVEFLPENDLPPPGPKPFFSLLDQSLSREISRQIAKPFWIDTVGRSALVEIRIKLDNNVMRVFAPRRLRVELGDFPVLDGGHVIGAARRRRAVPAQPDPPDPHLGGRGGKFRQGPRGARLPPARGAR